MAKSQKILGQKKHSMAATIWSFVVMLAHEILLNTQNQVDVDLQVAAVRMMSLAQWFLMSLPILITRLLFLHSSFKLFLSKASVCQDCSPFPLVMMVAGVPQKTIFQSGLENEGKMFFSREAASADGPQVSS